MVHNNYVRNTTTFGEYNGLVLYTRVCPETPSVLLLTELSWVEFGGSREIFPSQDFLAKETRKRNSILLLPGEKIWIIEAATGISISEPYRIVPEILISPVIPLLTPLFSNPWVFWKINFLFLVFLFVSREKGSEEFKHLCFVCFGWSGEEASWIM